MNQELELSEQLISEGFTPFGEIEELTKEELLKESVFEHIFSIENDIYREKTIIDLQLRARELKITRQFNNLLRIHRELYIKQT